MMRGAECDTDHQLLRIKLMVHHVNSSRKQLQMGKKYNVGLLHDGKLRDGNSDEVRRKS